MCGGVSDRERMGSDALSVKGGSESGAVRAKMLLPRKLFLEEARSLPISGVVLGRQGCPGVRTTWMPWEPEAPCPKLMGKESSSNHLWSKPQSSSRAHSPQLCLTVWGTLPWGPIRHSGGTTLGWGEGGPQCMLVTIKQQKGFEIFRTK